MTARFLSAGLREAFAISDNAKARGAERLLLLIASSQQLLQRAWDAVSTSRADVMAAALALSPVATVLPILLTAHARGMGGWLLESGRGAELCARLVLLAGRFAAVATVASPVVEALAGLAHERLEGTARRAVDKLAKKKHHHVVRVALSLSSPVSALS